MHPDVPEKWKLEEGEFPAEHRAPRDRYKLTGSTVNPEGMP